MPLLKVTSLPGKEVQHDAKAYASGYLRCFPFRLASSILVQSFTQALTTVISPGAGQSLKDFCRNVMERQQSMIAQGVMDIFSGQPFQIYQKT